MRSIDLRKTGREQVRELAVMHRWRLTYSLDSFDVFDRRTHIIDIHFNDDGTVLSANLWHGTHMPVLVCRDIDDLSIISSWVIATSGEHTP